MKEFLKVMKALSDANRVKILKILQLRTLCVCEIQEVLGVAQSTVSKHLRILEEAGLVTFEKEGLWVNYRIADPEGNPYAGYMLDGLQGRLEDDPGLAEMMERLPGIKREEILKRK